MSTEPTPQPKQPSTEIQQVLGGNKNQAIGEMSGGTAFGTVEGSILQGDNRRITIEKDAISSAIISGNGNKVVIYQYQLERLVAEEKTPQPGEIGANPYKGLLAFHEEDGDRYFGREEQIEKLWNLFRTLHENTTQPEALLRLLPILGPSGCGKSSLARAGLIPELARRPLPGKSQAWVVVLVPGTHPVEALATVLARVATNDQTPVKKTKEFEQVLKETSNTTGTIIYDGLRRIANVLPEIAISPLVVLVDQFEEVYSLCDDTEERKIFIDNLIHAAGDRAGYVSVIITLRSDFLGETQRHPALNQVIASQGAIVPAMSEEELRRAITKPAEIAGHPLDEAVVTLLLKDTERREGALPLLQFALTRIWEGLKEGDKPIETYQKIDGVGGALADEAQRIFNKLSDEDKKIARWVFLKLVQPGEGTSDTRRRANVDSLVSHKHQPEYVRRVIERFANPGVRLITLSSSEQGTETAEVTHEALFTNWGEMKEWLDSNRSDIRSQHRLDEAARVWHENGRPEGNLWRPPDLDLLEKYYQRANDNMTPLQVEFFKASKRAEKTRKQIQKLGIAGLLGGIVLTLSLSVFAGMGWWNAAISEIKSLAQSSDGFLNLDGPKALKSSIKAAVKMQGLWGVNANTRTEIELALLNTVHNVAAPNTLGGHANSVNGVSFSPDGKMLASASNDKTVKLWDTSTGKEIKTLTGHANSVNGVSFSPYGKMLASASADNTVKLWDTSTGKLIKTLTGHASSVNRISFSPNGKMLASTSNDQTVKLWDTSTGEEIKTLIGHTNSVWGVSFSPDGKMLASASADRKVKLWDTSTGKEIKTLYGHRDAVWGVSFSPNGKMLASASADKTVKLWDTSTRKLIQTLTGHTEGVGWVSFSPDGKMLTSASADKTVKLWPSSNLCKSGQPWQKTLQQGKQDHLMTIKERFFAPSPSNGRRSTLKVGEGCPDLPMFIPGDISTGKLIKTLTGHRDAVVGVSFSPYGKMLASASADNTVKLWDTSTGKEIKILTGHTEGVGWVSFSPDGKMLTSASKDKTVKLWDTSTGEEIKTLTGHTEGVWGVSFSPNGKMLASASDDKMVKLWDTSTKKEIKTLPGHTKGVKWVSFSPDGKILASASDDKTVKLWDTSTKKEIKTLYGHTDEVWGVSFSPDGTMLASASKDKTVKLWDTSTKKEIKTLTGHRKEVRGVRFSPNGKMLASASADNTIKLWDTSTGQEIQTLTGHRDVVNRISFSPNGKILASASADKTVKLWDTSTGEEIKTLTGHTDKVLGVSFSPNGKMLASASLDNTVKLWRWDFDYLLKEGCNFMGEYFKTNPPENESDKHLCDGVLGTSNE